MADEQLHIKIYNDTDEDITQEFGVTDPFRTRELWAGRVIIEDKEYMDVRAFQEKMKHLVNDTPGRLTKGLMRERVDFLKEELDELKEAMDAEDLDKMADALIDLVYVAKGTAVMMGLPWAALWDDVQRANLAKEPGVTARGYLFDAKKPEGWVPPNTAAILKDHGWSGHNPQVGRDYDCFLVDATRAGGKERT